MTNESIRLSTAQANLELELVPELPQGAARGAGASEVLHDAKRLHGDTFLVPGWSIDARKKGTVQYSNDDVNRDLLDLLERR